MDRAHLATALALLGLCGWGLVELAMRAPTPRARALRAGPEDGGTTRITALAVAASLVLPWVVRAVAPPASAPGPAALVAAGLVLAAGLALRGWAMASLGPAFTRTLVAPAPPVSGQDRPGERGPYRRVRHPGYLAALLVLPVHAALAAGRLLAGVAVLVLLGAVYARRIPVEEAMLARRFGAAWEDYRRRTARLVPGLL